MYIKISLIPRFFHWKSQADHCQSLSEKSKRIISREASNKMILSTEIAERKENFSKISDDGGSIMI